MERPDKKNIVIFASGSGSNAQRLLEHFENHPDIRVAALFSNNPKAYALKRAETYHVPALLFSRDEFYNSSKVLEQVKQFNPDDTPEELAARVLQLEHKYLPLVIEDLLLKKDEL